MSEPANPTYQLAVRHLIEVLGNISTVERRLKVPRRMIEGWAAGTSVPSLDVFLRIVDLLLKHDGRPR
jgi:hypothetical protein